MMKNYKIYQRYAPTNNKNNPVSADDCFLLQSIDARPLPWAVITANGISSCFFRTLREAEEHCIRKGRVLIDSEVQYDSFS